MPARKTATHPRAVAPRGARRLVQRDALMARLGPARRQRCIVVQGQAGSGKTSCLLAWRAQLLGFDFDVAWLTLAPEDNDAGHFLEGLRASLGAVDGAMVREATLLADCADEEGGAEHAVIALVQGITARGRELVLMLDDLHHVHNPRVMQALQWLLDYAPPCLHLALSSRMAIALSFERLRSAGQLTELDMRDLRFTAEESERYLREQLGRIDAADAAALHALTDGWVAGLQLLVLDLRARAGTQHRPQAQVQDAQAFSDYFEREVLQGLAPADLQLLLRAAISSRFCAGLCAALLGEPAASVRVQARLRALEGGNYFLTQVGPDAREPWYRLHPLLRETLLARLATGPEPARRPLEATAAAWFEAHGLIDEAVQHHVEAGDVARAAAMVEAAARDMLCAGELGTLAALLRRIPPPEIAARTGLQVATAYRQMYMRDFDACSHTLRALEAHAPLLDALRRYDLVLLRGGLALQRDDEATAATLLPQLQDIPPAADDLAWNSRGNVLAWLHILRGEHAAAREVFESVRERSGAPLSRLLGRCMGAISLAREGHAGQAEQAASEVLRTAEQRGGAYGGLAGMAAGLLAELLYERGDVAAAGALLAPRIALIERVTLPDIVLRAHLVLAQCHLLEGRPAQAAQGLDRLEALALRDGLERMRAEALLARLRQSLQQGAQVEAEATLAQIETLVFRGGQATGAPVHPMQLCIARARVAHALALRDYGRALETIEGLTRDAGPAAPAHGAALLLAARAVALWGQGDADSARQALLAALRAGHKLGLLRSLLDVSPELPRVWALLDRAALEPVLAFYLQRLEALAQGVPRASAEATPGPAAAPSVLSEREHEVLHLLGQAMPNKKIARALNVSPDTVKFHLKNIYLKLGVSARDEAVAKLRELEARQAAGSKAG